MRGFAFGVRRRERVGVEVRAPRDAERVRLLGEAAEFAVVLILVVAAVAGAQQEKSGLVRDFSERKAGLCVG